MTSTSDEFRRIYLPYCIEQVDGIGHVVLNRLYKPLGVRGRDHIDYAPHAVKLKGLGSAKASKLSWNASPDITRIWLYNDGCIPTAGAANWNAYQARLALLAKMKIA